jgi:hypothetical protein
LGCWKPFGTSPLKTQKTGPLASILTKTLQPELTGKAIQPNWWKIWLLAGGWTFAQFTDYWFTTGPTMLRIL